MESEEVKDDVEKMVHGEEGNNNKGLRILLSAWEVATPHMEVLATTIGSPHSIYGNVYSFLRRQLPVHS